MMVAHDSFKTMANKSPSVAASPRRLSAKTCPSVGFMMNDPTQLSIYQLRTVLTE
jgi:hypothetical protein